MKRFKMPAKKARKLFTRTAKSVHPKNGRKTTAMRGGIRL